MFGFPPTSTRSIGRPCSRPSTPGATALAEAGFLRAIWRVPGRLANRAIWTAADATALHEALVSLPLWPYMEVDGHAARAASARRRPAVASSPGWS